MTGAMLPCGPIDTTKLAGGLPEGTSTWSVTRKFKVSREPDLAIPENGPLLVKVRLEIDGGIVSERQAQIKLFSHFSRTHRSIDRT